MFNFTIDNFKTLLNVQYSASIQCDATENTKSVTHQFVKCTNTVVAIIKPFPILQNVFFAILVSLTLVCLVSDLTASVTWTEKTVNTNSRVSCRFL